MLMNHLADGESGLKAIGNSLTMDAHALDQQDAVAALDEDFDAPPIVRFDERRMHVRAYNYWASLLSDKTLPSIEDLNPHEIQDFGSHSVLLDFTSGVTNPSIAFLGSALSRQCDIDGPVDKVSQIPQRTLLSRLTDHYLQIVANAAPIGFEAEFTNQRGVDIMYRGIMMPFSSDDDTIDFVYGVINWKEVASDSLTQSIAAEVEAVRHTPPASPQTGPVWADSPSRSAIRDSQPEQSTSDPADTDAATLNLTHDDIVDAAADGAQPFDLAPDDMIDLPDADASLYDCLALAREAAEVATAGEARTRHALYRAIGLAHAFALAARSRPEDYAELLEDAGIAAQPRAPLTALLKLVFGADYDKTRLAEFACALHYALDEDLAAGALIDHLQSTSGGLKAVVAQMRAQRRGTRPAAPRKTASRARQKLAQAGSITPEMVATDESGLAVVVMRREADGSLAMIATLDQADKLIGRVLTAAARETAADIVPESGDRD